MAYRVVKLEWSDAIWRCYRCQNTIIGRVFRLQSPGFDNDYCDRCVESVDAVYNYYLEYQGYGYKYTFYDLETPRVYFYPGTSKIEHLLPKLTKL